jgi:nucleotide-binding universal stress UspA family protein
MQSSGGRVVVGVDGSPESVEALRWARGQAQLTGASLQVVTAWHVPVLLGYPSPGAYQLATVDWEGGARAAQDSAVAAAGELPTGTERAVVQGHPAQALCEAAEGADLLVVGSRGHGGFTGMLLGSVSEHVTAHSPCAVVVVRSADRA